MISKYSMCWFCVFKGRGRPKYHKKLQDVASTYSTQSTVPSNHIRKILCSKHVHIPIPPAHNTSSVSHMSNWNTQNTHVDVFKFGGCHCSPGGPRGNLLHCQICMRFWFARTRIYWNTCLWAIGQSEYVSPWLVEDPFSRKWKSTTFHTSHRPRALSAPCSTISVCLTWICLVDIGFCLIALWFCLIATCLHIFCGAIWF